MPTYSKLPKVVTDHALSLQKVNQAADNLQSVYDAMAVDHGTVAPTFGGVGGAGTPRVLQLGHHSSQRIPRAVIAYQASLSLAPFPVSGTVVPTMVTPDPHVPYVALLGTGMVFFRVVGLSQFYGDPVPHGSLSDVKFCVARSYFGVGTPGPGIYVTTFYVNGAGGAFAATNFDFDMAIYGAA